jgi:hypothetical protein
MKEHGNHHACPDGNGCFVAHVPGAAKGERLDAGQQDDFDEVSIF